MKKAIKQVVPDEVLVNKIHHIRDYKVMLDYDLAELYGIENKALKQAVRRNKDRFPKDFMFELNKKEFEDLRSQIVTSKSGGTRYMPMAFTEHGVLMLSSVLNSKRAIDMNIQIMRVFVKLKEMLLTHKDFLLKMNEIENKVAGQDEKIKLIFDYLKQFVNQQETPRRQIGYKKDQE